MTALSAGSWLSPRRVLLLSLAVFLLHSLPLLYTRWVEDENWYGAVGHALHTSGQIRNPTFANEDPEATVDPRPPGMAITLATAYQVFGVGPVEARLPFLAMALGTVALTFSIGAHFAGPWAGALAALLISTDNFLFLAGRTVRPEAGATFWGAAAVALFLAAGRRRSTLLAAAAGLAAGVCWNFHMNAIGVVAGIGVLLLYDEGWTFWRNRRFWAFSLGLIAAVIPFAVWIFSSDVNRQVFTKLNTRGQSASWALMSLYERTRYSDFIGLSSLRFRMGVPLPLRLHIALLILGSVAVAVRFRRSDIGWRLALFCLPSMLLWTIEVNATARFFAILAPVMAVSLAAAAVTLWQQRSAWRPWIAAAVAAVFLSQFAGNAYYLLRARQADYRAVTTGLRRLIPAGQPVYGALTFWMALHDASRYYAFNRTPFEYVSRRNLARYLILNDRVLLNGTGYGYNEYAPLGREATRFAAEHCTLIGKVPDPFYGDLEVYRVNNPPAPADQ